jgi:predicted DsbA family dithiol-disulfide isomerase
MVSQSLWANPDTPSTETAWKISKEAGLDIQKAQNYIASGKIDSLIKQDDMDRVAVDIHFAPTFYVNGRTLISTNPYELLELVRNEVDKISSS